EIAEADYGTLVEQLVAVLEGRDRGLLDELAARRDRLADELRFEEAAQARDRLLELEYVLGAQRKLVAVAQRNLVVVAPALPPNQREVLFIRGGRLARQLSERGAPDAGLYAQALCELYAGDGPGRPVSHDEVDEMHLLDEWLRRKREVLRQVPVEPGDPARALEALLQ